MTSVYLIRHGAYQDSKKIFNFRLPELHLAPQGREQASKMAARLSKEKIAAVYSSPIDRAKETAQVIAEAHKLSVLIDERLNDVLSPLQGLSRKLTEYKNLDGNFYQEKFIRQGGETLQDVFERMEDFVQEKVRQHQGEKFVVVSHCDPIMSVKSIYLDGKLPKFYSFSGDYVRQGSGYILTFEKEKLTGISSIYKYFSI